MSAAILCRAARLMRKRAEAVPASPWFAMELPAHLGREWLVDSNDRLIAGNIGISEDPAASSIAVHIASLDPVVAIAVADVLDAAVDLNETYTDCGDGDCNYSPCCTLRAAINLARAYLGVDE